MHAYALIQIERSEAALEQVVAGLRAHPRHAELLQNAGLLADRLTQPVESEGYFRTLTDIAPERGDAWLGLGNALQRQGRDDEALAAYTAAAAADPGNPSPLVNLANLYGKQDDHAGAQAAYREVLRRFPERGDVRANLAASLVRSKDYVAAVAVFEDYLRDEPDDFDVSLSRAKALLKAGDPAASIRALTDMANRFPDQPQTCPELVNAQLTQKNAAAAKSIVENFLDRFPKSADVYSCLPILNAALRPGELDEGKAALDAEIQVYDLAIPPEYTDAEDFFRDRARGDPCPSQLNGFAPRARHARRATHRRYGEGAGAAAARGADPRHQGPCSGLCRPGGQPRQCLPWRPRPRFGGIQPLGRRHARRGTPSFPYPPLRPD